MLRHIWDRVDGRGRRLRGLVRLVGKLENTSKAQRARWERDRAGLKRKIAKWHRRALSPDVVRELLPLRARTIGARAAHADAARYDSQLQDVSAAYREALAAAAQPGPDLAMTTLQGLTWWVPVPPSLSGKVRDRFIAKQRFPYRNITQTREFSVGPILLDIGANIGLMSIPRVILGDVERAYCAEPDPLNFAALVRNIASNGLRGLVLPDQVAIGAAAGPVRLRHAKYPGGHRLLTAGEPADGAIEVSCWTLDEWCRRLSIDPDLVSYVKVDTQGWEVYVLRGASNLLGCRHIAWQLEVAPALLDAAGTPASVLYDLCAERFTHFIHLGRGVEGPRAHRTRELPRVLGYLLDEEAPRDLVDIIVFNADERVDSPSPVGHASRM